MGRIQGVKYEGLHIICFHCGQYGHRNKSCPHVKLFSPETFDPSLASIPDQPPLVIPQHQLLGSNIGFGPGMILALIVVLVSWREWDIVALQVKIALFRIPWFFNKV